MKYNILWWSSVQVECLWMTDFGRFLRHLKASTKKFYHSNLNEIYQDNCCDPAINICKNHENWHVWHLSSDMTKISKVYKILALVMFMTKYQVSSMKETEVMIFSMMEGKMKGNKNTKWSQTTLLEIS